MRSFYTFSLRTLSLIKVLKELLDLDPTIEVRLTMVKYRSRPKGDARAQEFP